LRNSSALLEPADCTQTMLMPSLANSPFRAAPLASRPATADCRSPSGLRISRQRLDGEGADGQPDPHHQKQSHPLSSVLPSPPPTRAPSKTVCHFNMLWLEVDQKILKASKCRGENILAAGRAKAARVSYLRVCNLG
jgi:hypothetical protein